MKKINSRTKGASSEREFANIIFDLTGVRLIRNLEQSRSGGFDLIVHADENGIVADSFRQLAIECKRYSGVTDGLIKQWWGQAVKQSLDLYTPVLAYRANRQEWKVVAPLSLLNKDLTHNVNYDFTVTMSIACFCAVIRDFA
jgi:hypothetical protein